MDRALIGAPIDRSARAVGVFVPLNFRLSGPELAWNIGDASIHTLVAGEGARAGDLHAATGTEARGCASAQSDPQVAQGQAAHAREGGRLT